MTRAQGQPVGAVAPDANPVATASAWPPASNPTASPRPPPMSPPPRARSQSRPQEQRAADKRRREELGRHEVIEPEDAVPGRAKRGGHNRRRDREPGEQDPDPGQRFREKACPLHDITPYGHRICLCALSVILSGHPTATSVCGLDQLSEACQAGCRGRRQSQPPGDNEISRQAPHRNGSLRTNPLTLSMTIVARGTLPI